MKVTGQRFGRSRSWRGGNNSDQSGDTVYRSAGSVFRLIVHLCFCLASLVLGFRLSRESVLLARSLKNSEAYLHGVSTLSSVSSDGWSAIMEKRPLLQDFSKVRGTGLSEEDALKSSRVHVGRHDILVRPYPHPDPVDTMVAHSIMTRVQQEQRKLYGSPERRPIIAITPTFRRTFQALHLTSLMNTLKLVPGPVLWIVVEAEGRSAETATILSEVGLNYYHLYLKDPMPAGWPERHRMATRLRLRALRFIKDHEFEGIIVFADESNSHRLELFDEVQRVEWVGAFSVGLLMPPQASEEGNQLSRWNSLNVGPDSTTAAGFQPVQGPACNDSGRLIGWHSESGSSAVVKRKNKMLPNFEWAGFALNSAAILDDVKKPSWIKDFDEWVPQNGREVSVTDIVSDESHIEPLGDCGRRILLWWNRIEAKFDSKYPEGWLAEELAVVVPAKRTPWPPLGPLVNRTRILEELVDKSRLGKQSKTRKPKKKSVKK